MKRLIAGLLLMPMLATPMAAHKDEPKGNLYPMTMAVVGVEDSGEEYRVTIRRMTGFEYAFYSMDGDWMIGDIAACIMNDNGTPDDILDDRIEDVYYSGYGDPATW